MRNRALHDALREFALEAAALLTDDQQQGAELQFDVEDEGAGRRGPALYRYRPLTENYIAERWPRLRELPGCAAACEALGAGASSWLQVNGLRGEQAEPALWAMLERVYEDATSFGFPEERFERLYGEVEHTLYRDTVPTTVIAPLRGVELEAERVELGDGLFLARAGGFGAPTGDRDEVVCVLERDVAPEDPALAEEARERFAALVTGMRLLKSGGLTLGGLAWRRAGEARWTPIELDATGAARGAPWTLAQGEESELCDFLAALAGSTHGGAVSWALARFEMGCSRATAAEALSDYLLVLRALLDAMSDAGRASLGLRLAALCAEDGQRRAVQRRVERAMALERYVMGAGHGGELDDWIGSESPLELVDELEHYARALMRDIVCGYLDADLKGVADDILLEESDPAVVPEPVEPEEVPEPEEPAEIEARDLRKERRFEREAEAEPDTTEMEPVVVEAKQQPEGVTQSADWGWGGPEDYSAPV